MTSKIWIRSNISTSSDTIKSINQSYKQRKQQQKLHNCVQVYWFKLIPEVVKMATKNDHQNTLTS